GTNVALDGSGSSDPDNAPNPLTYSWAQTAGPNATLNGSTSAMPNFVAPSVMADTVLTFELTVSDGADTATDSVDITVQPSASSGSGGSSASSGGAGTGGMGTGGGGIGGSMGVGGEGGTGIGGEGGTGAAPGTGGEDGGCDCSIPGSNQHTPIRDAGSSLLAIVGAWLVRRRRQNRSS
ncbi:MAG TPA: hypothetical protein PK156_37270, partial [Polyangium sp.]|nr:hypothetical protein [Polyangium sp.]